MRRWCVRWPGTCGLAPAAWHLRVGGAWRALPPGLVQWRTAYGWFRRWLELGLFDALLRHVAGLRRRTTGRNSAPRLAMIDT